MLSEHCMQNILKQWMHFTILWTQQHILFANSHDTIDDAAGKDESAAKQHGDTPAQQKRDHRRPAATSHTHTHKQWWIKQRTFSIQLIFTSRLGAIAQPTTHGSSLINASGTWCLSWLQHQFFHSNPFTLSSSEHKNKITNKQYKY